jgi:hypothetical protein
MTFVAAPANKRSKFDPKTFLSTIDGGRTIAAVPTKQTIFAQGDSLSGHPKPANEGHLKTGQRE